jgi:nitrogen regulatory protein PII 2
MKEIIAIIRPSKMNATKKSLDELNIPSVTAAPVSGRGHQRGLNPILTGIEISKDALLKGHITGMKFVPKRMLIIVAKDEDVDVIVDAIVKSNKTGYIGDGKIFICPTDNALRIRTNETGDVAL